MKRMTCTLKKVLISVVLMTTANTPSAFGQSLIELHGESLTDSGMNHYVDSVRQSLLERYDYSDLSEVDHNAVWALCQQMALLQYDFSIVREEGSLAAVFEQCQYFADRSQRLLESKVFAKRAIRLVGEERYQYMLDNNDFLWGGALEKGVWQYHGCRQHCCGLSDWFVTYDPKKDKLSIRFWGESYNGEEYKE